MVPIALLLSFAFASSCLLTSLARRVAPRLGFVDAPDGQRKLHQSPTPLLGGAAIYLSIIATFVVGLLLDVPWLAEANHLTGLIASCSLFFFLGLVDDQRPLWARHKLIGQVIASLPFALWGRSITTVGLFGIDVSLGQWSILFTVFWLVSCSNIINLVDGMDGLASSISSIVLMTIAALAWSHGNIEHACLAMVVVAAVGGFLVHNLPPARIFLGDSGALMLGFLVGAISLETTVKRATVFTLVGTLVMVSVPFFDTTMAMLRRKLRGKRISEADSGHIHHRLQERGLSRRQSLAVMMVLSLAMAIVVVVSDFLHNDFVAVLLCGSLLASLVVGRIFGHYEAVMLARHIKAIGSLSKDLIRISGSRVMMVRLQDHELTRESNAWEMVCSRIAERGIYSLEFTYRDGNDEVMGQLKWQAEPTQSKDALEWRLHISSPADNGFTADLKVIGTTNQARAMQAADDLVSFCSSVCRNEAVIACAVKTHEGDQLTRHRNTTLPFTPSANTGAPSGESSSDEDEPRIRKAA